jgi:CheY-like chemotaxis protein
VITHVPAMSPERILVDPAELERAVLNLALNANDAMPDGGRFSVATLSLRGGADGGYGGDASWEVAIRVSDEGMGMDPQTAAHCFEPFFTTKGHARGTGLGLAAVHAFVTQAGGRISVDTAPELGTAFTLVFPHTAAEVGDGSEELLGDVVSEPELATGEETVLVVEDEPELRRLAVQALEWRGYRVLPAGGGSEALEVARDLRRRPDLLVTDVVMPGMSGVELAERLRKRWRTLPVLFVSGHLGQEALQDDPLGGPADLLVKPFTPDELGRRVRQALDRASRARREARVGQQSTQAG